MRNDHALLLTYKELIESSEKFVQSIMNRLGVDIKKIDVVVKAWGESGKLNTESLTADETALLFVGYHNTLLKNAVASHVMFSSLIANPPQTLAWVAKNKMQQLEDAQRAAAAIEKFTKENSQDPESWDPAHCNLKNCSDGPCQNLCEICGGHCLGEQLH